MASKNKTVQLVINSAADIPRVMGEIMGLVARAIAGGPVIVTLGRITRTIEQNRKMWPMLTDISKQAKHMGAEWAPKDWKVYCYSAWRIMEGNQCRITMGLEGEVVCLDYSTSALSKKDFSSLIEAIYSIGSRYEVQWSDRSLAVYEEYKEARRDEI